jgi:GDP-mannose 6-dehydrogenase
LVKIAVFGLGHLGSTVLACIASDGHQVIGIDIDPAKVDLINGGISPVREPGIDERLRAGLAEGRIEARVELNDGLGGCDLAIVCVGTPGRRDGAQDLAQIVAVTEAIAEAISAAGSRPLPVLYRSTIQPGTVDDVIRPIFRSVLGPDFDTQVELVFSPEFLREGVAIEDYLSPPKIIIGTKDAKPSRMVEALYAKIEAPRFIVGYREAEFAKFVDNAWHATKVAFGNEIGRLSLQFGVRPGEMFDLFVADTRLNISAAYLRPGGAFGGSCLPKDVRALQQLAAAGGTSIPLIDAILTSNDAHKQRLLRLATKGVASGARLLLVGLSFKAATDDLRESPNLELALALLDAGYALSIFDPLIAATPPAVPARWHRLAAHLVSRETAEGEAYDRVIVCNDSAAAGWTSYGGNTVNLARL